jgi:hypothetical protein
VVSSPPTVVAVEPLGLLVMALTDQLRVVLELLRFTVRRVGALAEELVLRLILLLQEEVEPVFI